MCLIPPFFEGQASKTGRHEVRIPLRAGFRLFAHINTAKLVGLWSLSQSLSCWDGSILLQAVPSIVNKILMTESLLMMINKSQTAELAFHLQADSLRIREISFMGEKNVSVIMSRKWLRCMVHKFPFRIFVHFVSRAKLTVSRIGLPSAGGKGGWKGTDPLARTAPARSRGSACESLTLPPDDADTCGP